MLCFFYLGLHQLNSVLIFPNIGVMNSLQNLKKPSQCSACQGMKGAICNHSIHQNLSDILGGKLMK